MAAAGQASYFGSYHRVGFETENGHRSLLCLKQQEWRLKGVSQAEITVIKPSDLP
jgi:hypothetical protein